MPRAWTLRARPKGMPQHSDFALIEQPAAALADGEVRVANRWLSVDPYMRGRMNDVKSYVPPFALGETLTGGAVGRVVVHRHQVSHRRRGGTAADRPWLDDRHAQPFARGRLGAGRADDARAHHDQVVAASRGRCRRPRIGCRRAANSLRCGPHVVHQATMPQANGSAGSISSCARAVM